MSAFKISLKVLLVSGWVLLAAETEANNENNYPQKPITVVVGYAAGGATDQVTRIIARYMQEDLGQPVIVENRPGASTNIAADYVARSRNDGYTIYAGTSANAVNVSLYKNLKHDFVKDFQPIGLMASIANVLVVHKDEPINNLAEYITYAKNNPEKMNCASSGVGSTIHMSCELFKLKTGTDILHVPYKGGGPAVKDLLGGQVRSMFDNLPSAMPHIRSHGLKAIATTTTNRLESLPETPTFNEQGYPDIVVEGWFGLNAPTGTPKAVIDRLKASLNNALAQPAVVEFYGRSNYQAPSADNSPEKYKEYIDKEVKKWSEVVSAVGIAFDY